MIKQESIQNGVLCWRWIPEDGGGPATEWTPYDIGTLSARAFVSEIACNRKNERINQLCGHINDLQTFIMQSGGGNFPLFGEIYQKMMRGTNIDKAGAKNE